MISGTKKPAYAVGNLFRNLLSQVGVRSALLTSLREGMPATTTI